MAAGVLATVLFSVMIILLAGGVWIAVSLGIVGWVALEFFTPAPAGSLLASTVWDFVLELGADGAPALRLDGGDPVSHAPQPGHVHRPLSLAVLAAGTPGACEHRRLRHHGGGGWFIRRHLRHGRPHLAAGAEEARL